MEKREHTENRVIGTKLKRSKDAIGFGIQVPMREHHAFGITRRSRGVQQDGEIVWSFVQRREWLDWLRENGV
jgi:hypothetical protein